MRQPATRSFRDLTGLAAWARGGLWLQTALSALAVVLALRHGPGFANETGDAAYLLVAVVQVLVWIAAGIVVLRWIFFANANAHTLGAQSLSSGPWLAIAWYFVPLACLAMPFQSMREIFKASANPRDWEIVRTPALLGGWWTFWLLSGFAGTAAFRLSFETHPGAARAAEILTTASDLLTIPASIFLSVIIARITALQSITPSVG